MPRSAYASCARYVVFSELRTARQTPAQCAMAAQAPRPSSTRPIRCRSWSHLGSFGCGHEESSPGRLLEAELLAGPDTTGLARRLLPVSSPTLRPSRHEPARPPLSSPPPPGPPTPWRQQQRLVTGQHVRGDARTRRVGGRAASSLKKTAIFRACIPGFEATRDILFASARSPVLSSPTTAPC